MKRPLILAGAVVATLFAATAARAGHVDWSIGIAVPPVTTVVSSGYAVPVGYAPRPRVLYSAPAPVYASPAVVYRTPAPVYDEPAPYEVERYYGEPRYRPSPWLKRRAQLGLPLSTPDARG